MHVLAFGSRCGVQGAGLRGFDVFRFEPSPTPTEDQVWPWLLRVETQRERERERERERAREREVRVLARREGDGALVHGLPLVPEQPGAGYVLQRQEFFIENLLMIILLIIQMNLVDRSCGMDIFIACMSLTSPHLGRAFSALAASLLPFASPVQSLLEGLVFTRTEASGLPLAPSHPGLGLSLRVGG